jgi:hypothetical protein
MKAFDPWRDTLPFATRARIIAHKKTGEDFSQLSLNIEANKRVKRRGVASGVRGFVQQLASWVRIF